MENDDGCKYDNGICRVNCEAAIFKYECENNKDLKDVCSWSNERCSYVANKFDTDGGSFSKYECENNKDLKNVCWW
jgi:hypothetical protein